MIRVGTSLLVATFAACVLGGSGARAQEPDSSPRERSSESPHGHGAGALDAALERAFREPRVASADPNPALAPGTIRVLVVDSNGTARRDQEVVLGLMRQGGERERISERTGQNGVAEFRDLATGSAQAYRVNVPYEGATASSAPFQLPPDVGYEVRIEVRPTIRSDRSVLLVLGQTMIELRDERLHVVQQARLSNLAAETYVFPSGGTRIRLPSGFLAFQSQPVMTDQRITEIAGEGLRIEGSLPTGQVTLAWAFDLPVTGSDMEFEISNPFRTFQYRVIATAPAGMSMEVAGMPLPVRFDDRGRALLGTEIQRSPDDPPLSSIHIRLRGIPGPGPARWIAVALAALLAVSGFVPSRGRSLANATARGLEGRRAALLAEAATLEAEWSAGEIGPEHRQKRRAAIVRELAAILREEDRLRVKTTPREVGSPRR